jgi:hypothetical protein
MRTTESSSGLLIPAEMFGYPIAEGKAVAIFFAPILARSAGVAQRQSTGFVNQRLRVRISPPAPSEACRVAAEVSPRFEN